MKGVGEEFESGFYDAYYNLYGEQVYAQVKEHGYK